jgi:hypothetical protein
MVDVGKLWGSGVSRDARRGTRTRRRLSHSSVWALGAVASALIVVLPSATTASARTATLSRSGGFSIDALHDGRILDTSVVANASPALKRAAQKGLFVARASDGSLAIVDRTLSDIGAISAAGASFVELSWHPYTSTTSYEITRDGKPLVSLAAGVSSFRDTHVSPGATYRYNVDPKPTRGIDTSKARMWSLSARVPRVSRRVSLLQSLQSQVVKPAVAGSSAPTTTVTYETFISHYRIGVPPGVCSYSSNYWFGGDDHGFDWTNPSYRTSVSAVITWTTSHVDSYVGIGTTHVYSKATGALVAQKTASGSQSYAQKLGSGSQYVDVQLVTHASNPFCSVGAIDGKFSMDLTWSGNYSIFDGAHRAMPSTYVFIYNGGNLTNVYEDSSENPACLIGSPACEDDDFETWGTF